MGNMLRAISSDGAVMLCAIDSTDMVARAEALHKSSAVVTAALGRLLTAASMIGCQMKNEKGTVTLKLNGDGPMGVAVALSDANGNVKGYTAQSVIELPLNEKGKLDVAEAVGRNGLLYVMRDFGQGEPYIGQAELVSGEIAEDITSYYANSEQVPTVCALGVLVNPDLSVKKAGGFLLQLLPGATDETIDQIEKNISTMKPVTEMLESGLSIEDISALALHGFDMEILDTFDAAYRCDCSRDRIEKALSSLQDEELVSLADEKGYTQIECHFCNKKYRYNRRELEEFCAARSQRQEARGENNE